MINGSDLHGRFINQSIPGAIRLKRSPLPVKRKAHWISGLRMQRQMSVHNDRHTHTHTHFPLQILLQEGPCTTLLCDLSHIKTSFALVIPKNRALLPGSLTSCWSRKTWCASAPRSYPRMLMSRSVLLSPERVHTVANKKGKVTKCNESFFFIFRAADSGQAKINQTSVVVVVLVVVIVATCRPSKPEFHCTWTTVWPGRSWGPFLFLKNIFSEVFSSGGIGAPCRWEKLCVALSPFLEIKDDDQATPVGVNALHNGQESIFLNPRSVRRRPTRQIWQKQIGSPLSGESAAKNWGAFKWYNSVNPTTERGSHLLLLTW